MPRRAPLVEHAMEAQVALRDLSHVTVPLWESALASGDWSAIAECKALAATLHAASVQARRIARLAEGKVKCADGLIEPGHGRTA